MRCEFCGTEVARRGSRGPAPRYCSRACTSSAGRRRRGEVIENGSVCVCGKSLAGRQSNAKVCSRRCRAWADRNPGVPHPSSAERRCQRCDVGISDRDIRSQYCSSFCRSSAYEGRFVPTERACAHCGQSFTAHRRLARFCGLQCRRTADFLRNYEAYVIRAKIRRATLRGVRTEQFSHLDVFERDGWICYLCKTPVNRAAIWPDSTGPSLDHVIPLVAGGEHSMANTRCTHLGCNLSKGSSSVEVAS